jgi:hypothetical protein
LPYDLGIKPDRLKVYLYRDADFDSVLTRRDEAGALADWGTTDIRLIFPFLLSDPDDLNSPPLEWACDVVGPNATFQIDNALTNLVPTGARVELWVGEQCWAAGVVTKKGVLA